MEESCEGGLRAAGSAPHLPAHHDQGTNSASEPYSKATWLLILRSHAVVKLCHHDCPEDAHVVGSLSTCMLLAVLVVCVEHMPMCLAFCMFQQRLHRVCCA